MRRPEACPERDRLREELTLAQIDHHAEAVDELDVQGIPAFAERVLPRASDLWVQASLDYKARLQQLFFPEGIAFDGIRLNRTAVTVPLFNYLAPDQSAEEILVSREGIEPSTHRLRVQRRVSRPQGNQVARRCKRRSPQGSMQSLRAKLPAAVSISSAAATSGVGSVICAVAPPSQPS
jgi:hypothetical protein